MLSIVKLTIILLKDFGVEKMKHKTKIVFLIYNKIRSTEF